jgi:uncharacterized protein YidB (DUF937 family)
LPTSQTGDRHRLARASKRIAEQHLALTKLEEEVRGAITQGDAERTRSALVQLEGTLEAHFELEERAYYPLADGLDAGTAERFRELRDEHQLLREGLGDLRDGLKQEGLGGMLPAFTAFAHDLAHHERREESLMEGLSRND